jgi:hypothetical protein
MEEILKQHTGNDIVVKHDNAFRYGFPWIGIQTFKSGKMNKTLSKQEALDLMGKGIKVTHHFFSKKEWMTLDKDGKLLTEDGCTRSVDEFYQYRKGKEWEVGYFVFVNRNLEQVGVEVR